MIILAQLLSSSTFPPSSLSWSRNGSKLVSASTDNNVSVWDVVTGECEQRLRFPSPVLRWGRCGVQGEVCLGCKC